MKRFFTIEDVNTRPDGVPIGPPQVKIVRQQVAPSFGLFRWRQMGVRLVLLRAKRHAKHVP